MKVDRSELESIISSKYSKNQSFTCTRGEESVEVGGSSARGIDSSNYVEVYVEPSCPYYSPGDIGRTSSGDCSNKKEGDNYYRSCRYSYSNGSFTVNSYNGEDYYYV